MGAAVKNELEDDDRAIRHIRTASGFEYGAAMGHDRITVTIEPGDGAYVVWFAVWLNGVVIGRVNSRHVEFVGYE